MLKHKEIFPTSPWTLSYSLFRILGTAGKMDGWMESLHVYSQLLDITHVGAHLDDRRLHLGAL